MEGLDAQIETRLKGFLLSLSLRVGDELVALVGRSGAGKTTVLRAVAGVYVPDNASIVIGERTVFSTGLGINVPASDRHIGYVPQTHALYPHLTVFENVLVALQKQRVPDGLDQRRRVAETLDLLGLWRFRNTMPENLGIPEQQRAALARALVADPDLLLIDDPWNTLPTADRRHARVELADLRRLLHVPTLLATGELEEAYEIADRVALLDGGALLQVDEPRALLTRPSSRRVAEIVRSVNVIPAIVLDDDADGATVRTALGQLRVAGAPPIANEIDLVIRPEHVRLHAEPVRVENAIDGEIAGVTDYGSVYGIVFLPGDEPDAPELHVFLSEHAFRELGLREGARCWAVLPAESLHVMPRGQEPPPGDEPTVSVL